SNILNDYREPASWISENSKGAKWLSKLLESYSWASGTNITVVEYMMDTNVWSPYFAGDFAEYAMGGPTIELFCESYKDTHPNAYIDCNVIGSDGYSIKWSKDNDSSYTTLLRGVNQDDYNSIYIKTDMNKADGMLLASPSS